MNLTTTRFGYYPTVAPQQKTAIRTQFGTTEENTITTRFNTVWANFVKATNGRTIILEDEGNSLTISSDGLEFYEQFWDFDRIEKYTKNSINSIRIKNGIRTKDEGNSKKRFITTLNSKALTPEEKKEHEIDFILSLSAMFESATNYRGNNLINKTILDAMKAIAKFDVKAK